MIVPGVVVPGTVLPGVIVPGIVVPGEVEPGVVVPGMTLPGVVVPGKDAPGVAVPGMTLPGVTGLCTLPVPDPLVPELPVAVPPVPEVPPPDGLVPELPAPDVWAMRETGRETIANATTVLENKEVFICPLFDFSRLGNGQEEARAADEASPKSLLPAVSRKRTTQYTRSRIELRC